ncbi:MAG: acylphosphatase [Candidatus Aenigmatarchaeota archaeon]
MDELKCVFVKIHGFVQGVGFRHYIRSFAKKLDIKGWVRNAEDGTVEAIFEGSENSVNKILEFCKKGPELANVSRIEVKEESPYGFIDFEIRH